MLLSFARGQEKLQVWGYLMSAFHSMIIITFSMHFNDLMMIISVLTFKCLILLIRSTLEKNEQK